MLCSHSINPSTVFFYNQLGKIRRQHWTEHLNISKLAKFESDSERHIARSLYAKGDGGGGDGGLELALGLGLGGASLLR